VIDEPDEIVSCPQLGGAGMLDGFSASHRQTIYSWVEVSLGGRSGMGRAARPSAP
jgi:hypothetical protein